MLWMRLNGPVTRGSSALSLAMSRSPARGLGATRYRAMASIKVSFAALVRTTRLCSSALSAPSPLIAAANRACAAVTSASTLGSRSATDSLTASRSRQKAVAACSEPELLRTRRERVVGLRERSVIAPGCDPDRADQQQQDR